MRMLCTWTTTCPAAATHRMEQRNEKGGSVEFVCDHHVKASLDNGYAYRPADDARDGEATVPGRAS